MDEFLFEDDLHIGYQPKRVQYFEPDTIVLTKGTCQTVQQRNLVEAICRVYPKAQVVERFDIPHNRFEIDESDLLKLHYKGKSTLVFGVHKSALRFSEEDGNTCPNYWHFSPYGFCPYDCKYCYLAGTPGVKFSPTVKIFVNIGQILEDINHAASNFTEPKAFYLGKLQDGLALDNLTGYSRIMVPFFAEQKYARMILLTKCSDVDNLLDIEHKGHTILSWSLNPPEVCEKFETNVSSIAERIAAMEKCANAGYPVRAVIMPIIPVDDWQQVYSYFLESLLKRVELQRITLGQICSYSAAMQLTERKLGQKNLISDNLENAKSPDGRMRFSFDMRAKVYGYLIEKIRKLRPDLQIGLCLEEKNVFKAHNIESAIGQCNCVL